MKLISFIFEEHRPRHVPPEPACSQPLLLYLRRFQDYFDCQQRPTGLTVSIPEHIFGTHDEHFIPNLASVLPCLTLLLLPLTNTTP